VTADRLQLMIMEAMRLSLLEHEDHQRRVHTEGDTSSNTAANAAPLVPSSLPNINTLPPSGPSSRRPSGPVLDSPSGPSPGGKDKSAASKLFSKFGNRSRSGSSASANKVTFATSHAGPSTSNLSGSRNSTTPSTPPLQSRPLPSSNFSPSVSSPVAPLTTFTNSTEPFGGDMPEGLPRLSLDMPAMIPDAPPSGRSSGHVERAPLNRMDTDISEAPTERPSYARLDSDQL
jgi:hypothetical protein